MQTADWRPRLESLLDDFRRRQADAARSGDKPDRIEAARAWHAADGDLDAFRAAARDYLAAKDHFVIVNYLRKAIGQQTGGHISPLAAYDAKVDRFLILDVARYKYPPVWVKASDLFDAMNTTDAVNDNKTRGYVLVAKTGTVTPGATATGTATPAP